MPIDEKEYNGYLFDQLTLLERLEIEAKKDNAVNVLKQIEFEKRAVERKLYQPPTLMKPNDDNARCKVFLCTFSDLFNIYKNLMQKLSIITKA